MHRYIAKAALPAAAMLVAFGMQSAAANAATFTMTGNSSTTGSYGNVREFTSGSVSVKVTGFSIKSTTSGNVLQTAYVGAYGGGLGITDRSEDGSVPSHTVDNNGLDEFLLFQFSEDVIISGLGFSAYGDTDFSYSIASTTNAYSSLYSPANYSAFAAKFIPTIDVAGPSGSNGSYVTQTVNATAKAGNLFVIAASLLASQTNDAFKVKTITYSVAPPPTSTTPLPEPTTWAMMVGGLALIGMSMRRRKVAVSFA